LTSKLIDAMLFAQSSCCKLSVHGSQIDTYMDRHIIMKFVDGNGSEDDVTPRRRPWHLAYHQLEAISIEFHAHHGQTSKVN
jgi:hypothetical protein